MVKSEDYKHPFFIQKPLEWIVFLTEHFAYKISDLLLARGHGYKNYLRKKGYKIPINYFPDGTPCNKFKPINVNSLKKKLNLNKNLVLGSMGHLFWDFKLEFSYGTYMIESMQYLKDLKIKAIIVGDGIGKKYLKARVNDLGLNDKIIFQDRVPYSEYPKYVNLLDICIFTLPPKYIYNQIRTTGKLPELFATGTYIISSNWHEATLAIKENGKVLKFNGLKDTEYPKKLAKEIRKIHNNREILKKGLKGREIAKKVYDYKILSVKLEKYLRHIS